MFEFAWPWMFLLLPLPWLIRHFLKPATQQSNTALLVPFYQHIAGLKQSSASTKKPINSRKYLAYLAWFLLLTAAAGPQWLGKPITLPRNGRNIMLALDISGSMQIPDMQLNNQPANRLDVVKTVARQFIANRRGDRLGLILFATRAYSQTPLTFDRHAVLQMLNDASIGLAGARTAIGDAIGLAIKQLQKIPQQSRVLILLTDGGNNAGVIDPIEAAKLAAENHIKIYTIGIGANQMVLQGLFGPQIVNPSSDLDENSLRKIAELTGGLFFRATDTKALINVYKTIDKLEPISSDTSMFRPITLYYYWPLLFALLISIYFALRECNFNVTVRPAKTTKIGKSHRGDQLHDL